MMPDSGLGLFLVGQAHHGGTGRHGRAAAPARKRIVHKRTYRPSFGLGLLARAQGVHPHDTAGTGGFGRPRVPLGAEETARPRRQGSAADRGDPGRCLDGDFLPNRVGGHPQGPFFPPSRRIFCWPLAGRELDAGRGSPRKHPRWSRELERTPGRVAGRAHPGARASRRPPPWGWPADPARGRRFRGTTGVDQRAAGSSGPVSRADPPLIQWNRRNSPPTTEVPPPNGATARPPWLRRTRRPRHGQQPGSCEFGVHPHVRGGAGVPGGAEPGQVHKWNFPGTRGRKKTRA